MTTTSFNAESNVLLLGSGFRIEGNIHGAGTLLLGGMVNGSIQAETVKITESGQVLGVIECSQLDIAGKLEGGFHANDVIVRDGAFIKGSQELLSKGTCLVSGTINGALKANNLQVENLGSLIGNILVNQLDVYGKIIGAVDGASVIVRNGAVVDGSIQYDNLAMESGSDITGQLERKRRTPSASANTQTLTVDFPEALIQELRKNGAPDSLKVSLANGESLPAWINVDHAHFQLVMQKSAIGDLRVCGQTVRIRLEAGDEVITFTLPPESQ